MVYKEAVRTGLKGIPRSQTPSFKKLMKENGHLILPIIIILYVLIMGYTPLFAGLVGVVSCYGISFFRRSSRMGVHKLLTAMRLGAEDALPITAAICCCGIIIGVVTLTGVGLKIGYGIVNLAGGSLFFTLVLAMTTSLILGMGVPTTANYILTAAVAAPALIMLKVEPLAAHMFVFYYGLIADLTPPVALGALTAAGLAKADPLKTAFTSCKLAAVAILMPYFFVYNPFLLFIEVDFVRTTIVIVTSFIAIFALSTAVSGYWYGDLNIWMRVPLAVAALALLDPGIATDVAGVGLIVLVGILVHIKRGRLIKQDNAKKDNFY
jgi:TRAP transporter 4TM/12TM fusion protein